MVNFVCQLTGPSQTQPKGRKEGKEGKKEKGRERGREEGKKEGEKGKEREGRKKIIAWQYLKFRTFHTKKLELLYFS